MRYLFFILLLLITPFINSCKDDDSFENITTVSQETVTEKTVEDSYTTGKIRVKFTEELALQIQTTLNSSKDSSNTTKTEVKSVDNALSSLNVTNLKRTLPYCGKFEKRTHEAGLDRWYDITFDKSNSLTKANNDLSSIDGIDKVEYIPIVKISGNIKNTVSPSPSIKNYSNIVKNEKNDSYPFNDPGLKAQWHYYNDGVDYSSYPYNYNMVKGCDINVLPVWKNFTTGDENVIVAVIDMGIDINHEDLNDNIWENSSELNGTPGVDDDNNGYIDDINGYNFVLDTGSIVSGFHGTHVAGTIGAINNNGIGVCGIAGGDKENNIKGVRLMSCEIFEYYTDDNGDIKTVMGNTIGAIKYAADNGAVIANCSWGYIDTTSNYIPTYEKETIDYFIKYAGIDENGLQTGPMKGGVIIFAAGNYDTIYGPPGSYESAISVAALASDYQATSYTNYGDWVDISAPGGDIFHAILSTTTNNQYCLEVGASMACPHVSGVAALLVSYFGGSGFTNDMLKERLLNSANDIIYDYSDSKYTGSLGSGLVDARAAFLYDSTNNPPVITSENKSPVIIHYHENTYINFTVSDSEDQSFTITTDTGSTAATFSLENMILSIAGNQAEEGTYNFVLTATDELGAKTTYKLEYTILPNNPPTTTGEIENIVFNGISGSSTITLTDYFTDIDGETLTYNIKKSTSSIINNSISDEELKIQPIEYGNTKITVTASDAKGESCSLTFKVLVRSDIKSVDVYPNPVTSSVSIRTGKIINDVTITFTNTSGTQVKKINADSIGPFAPVEVDLSDLAAGVYSVKITSSGNERFSSSIIKL